MKRLKVHIIGGLLLMFFFCVCRVSDAAAQKIIVSDSSESPANLLPYANYFKIRDGLPVFYKKAEAQVPVTVAFLGGSITYNPGWREMICKYLQQRFPNTPFHFIAAGIPSLGSVPHAFRLQQDVLDTGKVDLLFVEAAVNDRSNGTDSVTQIRSLDGIVRHTKKNNKEVDIVLMSFADPNKLKDYSEGKKPVEVENHELVAQYYSYPSLNLAKEVYDKIQAKEFSWEHDFKNLHPSPFGQKLYYESIKDLLEKCFNKADSSSGIIAKKKLLPPMNEYSFQSGCYYPISGATLTGFERIADWAPADSAATRKGFVNIPVLEALKPGSQLTLSFKGTAVGIAVLAGPDAGVLEYSIDNGSFVKFDLFTQWSKKLHLPRYKLFSGNLKKGEHTLRLRIAQDKNAQSNGTACRIVYFLVNQ